MLCWLCVVLCVVCVCGVVIRVWCCCVVVCVVLLFVCVVWHVEHRRVSVPGATLRTSHKKQDQSTWLKALSKSRIKRQTLQLPQEPQFRACR